MSKATWIRGTVAGTVLSCAVGIFLGVSGFTFYSARGLSYLSNDPVGCVNCHIMRDEYDSWQKSSHHAFATCNDCHTPHDLVGKYTTKATQGFRHSKGFTFQDFHEPIQLHHSSKPVLQANCVGCHGDLVSEITRHSNVSGDVVNCIRCHESVGHGQHR